MKIIKTIKQIRYMSKQTHCLMVITKNKYYLTPIKLYSKYKGWRVNAESDTHLQIKVGTW